MDFRPIVSVVLIWAFATGCASVPDSVLIAVKKEGEAIQKVEQDYRTSVDTYHKELLRQVDNNLDQVFEYEIKKMAQASGQPLTSEEVIALDKQRKNQQKLLYEQAEQVKKKMMNSINLKILKALHQKIENFVESDQVDSDDLGRLLEEIKPLMSQLSSS